VILRVGNGFADHNPGEFAVVNDQDGCRHPYAFRIRSLARASALLAAPMLSPLNPSRVAAQPTGYSGGQRRHRSKSPSRPLDW
jgi:hypothetical protein